MDLLTVAETAQLLKLSPITIRRYIASGRLAAVKVGRAVRIERTAVAGLLTPVNSDQARQADDQLDDRQPAEHSLLHIASLARPGEVAVARTAPVPKGKPTSEDDPLWTIVGLFDSGPDAPTDVARDKYTYLADAYDVSRR